MMIHMIPKTIYNDLDKHVSTNLVYSWGCDKSCAYWTNGMNCWKIFGRKESNGSHAVLTDVWSFEANFNRSILPVCSRFLRHAARYSYSYFMISMRDTGGASRNQQKNPRALPFNRAEMLRCCEQGCEAKINFTQWADRRVGGNSFFFWTQKKTTGWTV